MTFYRSQMFCLVTVGEKGKDGCRCRKICKFGGG